jgi:hypothetical protein
MKRRPPGKDERCANRHNGDPIAPNRRWFAPQNGIRTEHTSVPPTQRIAPCNVTNGLDDSGLRQEHIARDLIFRT